MRHARQSDQTYSKLQQHSWPQLCLVVGPLFGDRDAPIPSGAMCSGVTSNCRDLNFEGTTRFTDVQQSPLRKTLVSRLITVSRVYQNDILKSWNFLFPSASNFSPHEERQTYGPMVADSGWSESAQMLLELQLPHARLAGCAAIGHVSPPASPTLPDSSFDHMRGVTAWRVGTPDQGC